MRTFEEMDADWQLGYDARKAGKALNENPKKPNDPGWATWSAGWMVADDEAK